LDGKPILENLATLFEILQFRIRVFCGATVVSAVPEYHTEVVLVSIFMQGNKSIWVQITFESIAGGLEHTSGKGRAMEHNEGSVGRGTGRLAIRIVELNPVRQFDCVFGVVRHPSTEEDKSGLSLLTIGRLVNLEAKMINVPRLSFCVPEHVECLRIQRRISTNELGQYIQDTQGSLLVTPGNSSG
jgi:hypothetical protein